ncbi:MAG: metallophosphoesterase [Deltaproteobacteria bacterium]|nr:metallophosphoesterase [Deltaproteobacteria bacterium]
MAVRKPYRIVHLSDLHLTRTAGARRTELGVFSPLKGMNETFARVLATKPVQQSDLVIVTGDVTDRGDLPSWNVFWKTVKKAGLQKRIFVVPGNHDVCCLGARLPFKREGYRAADIQKAIKGLKLGGQATRFPFVAQPDRRVVVFGVNSNNLGNLTILSNAMGKLGYYQLVSLASKLHKYRDVPVKIIALHHSPNIPQVATAKKRGQPPMSALSRKGHQIPQEQRQALRLLCITHRVRLLIHGHLHLAEDRRVSGVRIIGAPATTEPLPGKGSKRAYQFYSYTVQGQGGRVRCELKTVTI